MDLKKKYLIDIIYPFHYPYLNFSSPVPSGSKTQKINTHTHTYTHSLCFLASSVSTVPSALLGGTNCIRLYYVIFSCVYGVWPSHGGKVQLLPASLCACAHGAQLTHLTLPLPVYTAFD